MFIVRNLIVIIFCIILIGCKKSQSVNISESERPNVIIIYPEQFRRYSSGYWSEDKYKDYRIGNPDPVITPNIDKLAKNGIVFTNAISNFPLCTPARAMLHSGRYPQQNGAWNNSRIGRVDHLRNDIPTITDVFHDAGYTTAYFGKCHWEVPKPLFDKNGNYIGTDKEPGGYYLNDFDTYIPPGRTRHQIDYIYQSIKDEHFNPRIFSNDPKTIEGKKDGEIYYPKEFATKTETKVILDYIKNSHKQRDTDKPFFFIWSTNPPHMPWNKENVEEETLNKYYNTKIFPKNKDLLARKNATAFGGSHARYYFSNVTSVDKYIGEVLNELKKSDLLDNTLIIFSSDHGEMLGSHGVSGINTSELEALAIPLILHWPKRLQPSINNTIVNIPDMLPTIMGLCGLSNQIPKGVEGNDLSDHIQNDSYSSSNKTDDAIIIQYRSRGLYTEKYTICVMDNENYPINTYLYDNIKDPYQLKKLTLKEVSKYTANDLLTRLGTRLKETNDPWYKEEKRDDVIIYPN